MNLRKRNSKPTEFHLARERLFQEVKSLNFKPLLSWSEFNFTALLIHLDFIGIKISAALPAKPLSHGRNEHRSNTGRKEGASEAWL